MDFITKLRSLFDTIWPTVTKYAFTLLLILIAFSRVPNPTILVISIVELALVFFGCNELAGRSRLAASIASGVALLLIDVQLLVLVFSNTFTTLVMLTNLDSLEDLSGKAVVYGFAAILMLAIICLPHRRIELRLPSLLDYVGRAKAVLAVLAVWEVLLLTVNGAQASPLFAYADLAHQQAAVSAAEGEISEQPNMTLEFYQAGIGNFYTKPAQLGEHPNVVLIFTEGLSSNIVHDERQIMPNVAALEATSLCFENYYNHTFATYRGLIGQLYSGYQHANYDPNTLVSLPQILREEGYASAFINVEGYNKDFTNYLDYLGFDEVIDCHDEKQRGPIGDGLSDKLAYERLFDEMEARHGQDKPFFLSIYTFGTHASFDSSDEKFGDGSDSEINKFYDADYQFGAFMDKFRASDMAKDTLIVFTTDHCTYADMYFTQSFPEHKRDHMELDQIPLIFYYDGVQAERINAGGRNSLDLAPTICDFLDISNQNYFLGTTLFGPLEISSPFETYFSDGNMSGMTTRGAEIRVAGGEVAEFVQQRMWNYYAAKRQDPLTPDDLSEEERAAFEAARTSVPRNQTKPETEEAHNASAGAEETSTDTEPPATPEDVEGEA